MERVGRGNESFALDTESLTQQHFRATDCIRTAGQHTLRRSVVGSQLDLSTQHGTERIDHRGDSGGYTRHRGIDGRQFRHQPTARGDQTERIGARHHTSECGRCVLAQRMSGDQRRLDTPRLPERRQCELHRDDGRLHVSCIREQSSAVTSVQHIHQLHAVPFRGEHG